MYYLMTLSGRIEVYMSDHYFPIMRWKDAEKGALQLLTPSAKNKITPIIEIVPRSLKLKKSKLDNVVSLFDADPLDIKKLNLQKTIDEIAATYFPKKIYIDLKYLRLHQIWKFNVPSNVILTIGLGNPHEDLILETLKTSSNGICFRITKNDLDSKFFQPRFNRLMRLIGLTKSSIDLLIDLGVTPKNSPLLEMFDKIPELNNWRTLILSSGSFPTDLTGITRNSIELLSRSDWLYWREQTNSLPIGIRRPLYSDYTIIHPNYEPPKGGVPSCSIRYTGEINWVVLRGEQVRADGPGFEQYNGQAQLLIEHDEYCTEVYSEGDRYIYSMAQDSTHHGNPGTWLKAGINHHLTHVVHQLSNIFGTEAPELLPASMKSNPLF